MALVATNEDVILLGKKYCEKCAVDKFQILKFYSITDEDFYILKHECKTKIYHIKCTCK